MKTWNRLGYIGHNIKGLLLGFYKLFLTSQYLGEHVWQDIFLVLGSEGLWIQWDYLICYLSWCLGYSFDNWYMYAKCMTKVTVYSCYQQPIACTIASIPVAAVVLENTKSVKIISKIFWVLLWWNSCGKVAVENCVICIQLKSWSWLVIFFVFNKF